MPILKLERDDEEREFEFDLDYLMSLTTPQRYELMFRRSAEAVERMIRHGYINPIEIVKRSARPVRRHRRDRVSDTRVRSHDRGHRHSN